jgi:two-component system sensor histidine kinase KdpD
VSDTGITRGRLKIFLGYAAGVGKTYQMLNEAHALKQDGVDVVVGYFEPHGRQETMVLIEGLEVVPRRTVRYRGAQFEEMDTEAVIRRRPQVAIVDEFPHTNVPGSEREKRWQDAHLLLDAGIDVHTTMNVQHVESLNDQIWQSTGVRVRETIPDWVVKQADEVVMVDLTPGALLHRLERGVVYPPERAKAALQNFFREPTLVALRELAMRQTAYAVETRQPFADLAPGPPTAPVDRLLLLLDPHPTSAALIRRGRRVADYLRADCVAILVVTKRDLSDLSPEQRADAAKLLTFARGLQIDTQLLEGEDVASVVVDFARRQRVTQIFLARHPQRTVAGWFGSGFIQRLVNLAQDMQVTVIADRSTRAGARERS